MRERLFRSSHAVLRLRRERALEKENEVRLSMCRNGNPSLRPAAIITRAATAREQPQHANSHSASSHSERIKVF